MKNTLKTVVSALAIASFASLSFAGAGAAAPAAPAKTADAKPAVATAKIATVTGKVISVDAAKNSFKLSEVTKGADGKETTKEVEVWWTETTKLAWHNEAKTAATKTDLKAGAEVTVKAEANKDGNWVATEVWFTPAATPAAK